MALDSTYPQLVPSSRSFDPGNFAVKSYNAQDGAEVRFIYGDKRVGMKLQLTYQNISDTDAEAFINHLPQDEGHLYPVLARHRTDRSEEGLGS